VSRAAGAVPTRRRHVVEVSIAFIEEPSAKHIRMEASIIDPAEARPQRNFFFFSLQGPRNGLFFFLVTPARSPGAPNDRARTSHPANLSFLAPVPVSTAFSSTLPTPRNRGHGARRAFGKGHLDTTLFLPRERAQLRRQPRARAARTGGAETANTAAPKLYAGSGNVDVGARPRQLSRGVPSGARRRARERWEFRARPAWPFSSAAYMQIIRPGDNGTRLETRLRHRPRATLHVGPRRRTRTKRIQTAASRGRNSSAIRPGRGTRCEHQEPTTASASARHPAQSARGNVDSPRAHPYREGSCKNPPSRKDQRARKYSCVDRTASRATSREGGTDAATDDESAWWSTMTGRQVRERANSVDECKWLPRGVTCRQSE